jgi:N6-adenosine-specific RNA methylase IME4
MGRHLPTRWPAVSLITEKARRLLSPRATSSDVTLPAGPFGCILADPPWQFATYGGAKAVPTQSADPYATMSLDQLASLPVAKAAAKDCALFMWVVDSHFDQALELGARWGFTFKTCAFVWVKSRGPHLRPDLGMGYWTRKQTEQCWLFTRGKPKPLGRGVEQALFCGRGAHSAKPEEQYERIEALVGGPYLELFARQTRAGWSAWGNQTTARDGLFGTGAAA